MRESAINVKKEAIYTAAAYLFHEKGYAATSMRELASAVGLEASSLYSHISSKAELLDHICFQVAAHFTQGMQIIQKEESKPLDQIRALVDLHIRVALEDPMSQTVFNDEWRHLPQDRLDAFLLLRKDYEQRFLDILVEARNRGDIRDISPRLILNTILSALRWLYAGKKLSASISTSLVHTQLKTILLHGLVAG